MRYEMATIVATRRPTQDGTSVFLSSDGPVGLSMREILGTSCTGFLLYNVRVDLICYVIAEREGHYAECAETPSWTPGQSTASPR